MTNERALAEIDAAFASAPRPTNRELLHPQCADDNDIVALYAYPHWHDVPDDLVEREYAALSFLSAAAFRHFLPAYLRWVLRRPESGAAVVSSTVWSLDPTMYEAPLDAFAASKFDELDEAQTRAIVKFLEAMPPDEDVDRALAYWNARIGAR